MFTRQALGLSFMVVLSLHHLLLKQLNIWKPTLSNFLQIETPSLPPMMSSVPAPGISQGRCPWLNDVVMTVPGLLVEFLRPTVGHDLFPQPRVETSTYKGPA